jgi:transposase
MLSRMAHSLLVSDGLWAVLEALLPERPARRVGRRRVDDRVAFTAIPFCAADRTTVAVGA